MWDVLELACSNDSVPALTVGNGLLHWSLASTTPPQDHIHDEVVFEAGGAVSDGTDDMEEADGGQSAPVRVSTISPNTAASTGSYHARTLSNGVQTFPNNISAATGFNASLFWDNNEQLANSSTDTLDLHAAALGDIDNVFWWEFGNT